MGAEGFMGCSNAAVTLDRHVCNHANSWGHSGISYFSQFSEWNSVSKNDLFRDYYKCDSCKNADFCRIIKDHYRSTYPYDVVSDFLLRSLIKRPAVISRKDVTYFTTRRWRASVADTQKNALRAAKINPPSALVEAAAQELVEQISKFCGYPKNWQVVPIPPGHSRNEENFAVQVARSVAEMLHCDFLACFEPQFISGCSHPKENTRRPRMRLRSKPNRQVILIDDVATSGTHIWEATNILRKSVPTVLPMVWIGPSSTR